MPDYPSWTTNCDLWNLANQLSLGSMGSSGGGGLLGDPPAESETGECGCGPGADWPDSIEVNIQPNTSGVMRCGALGAKCSDFGTHKYDYENEKYDKAAITLKGKNNGTYVSSADRVTAADEENEGSLKEYIQRPGDPQNFPCNKWEDSLTATIECSAGKATITIDSGDGMHRWQKAGLDPGPQTAVSVPYIGWKKDSGGYYPGAFTDSSGKKHNCKFGPASVTISDCTSSPADENQIGVDANSAQHTKSGAFAVDFYPADADGNQITIDTSSNAGGLGVFVPLKSDTFQCPDSSAESQTIIKSTVSSITDEGEDGWFVCVKHECGEQSSASVSSSSSLSASVSESKSEDCPCGIAIWEKIADCTTEWDDGSSVFDDPPCVNKDGVDVGMRSEDDTVWPYVNIEGYYKGTNHAHFGDGCGFVTEPGPYNEEYIPWWQLESSDCKDGCVPVNPCKDEAVVAGDRSAVVYGTFNSLQEFIDSDATLWRDDLQAHRSWVAWYIKICCAPPEQSSSASVSVSESVSAFESASKSESASTLESASVEPSDFESSSSVSCCGSAPDALKGKLYFDLMGGVVGAEPCGGCYSYEFDMNKTSSPSATATSQCAGLGGVGKVWQGSFTTDCETCTNDGDEDPDTNTSCQIQGSVELVCCNQHSTALSDQATYTINLFRYNDFTASGLLTSTEPASQCDFAAICGQGFADTVNSYWSSDCGGDTCTGIMNTDDTITIYDPANPPSDIDSHDCNECPDGVGFQLNFIGTGSLRMPMVALDAKTGKPLSFIV